MSRSVSLAAPAKINLVLRVLHRRADGYRELETVFQMISLADRVVVTVLDEGDDEHHGVHLDLDGPDLGPVESNLAYRAAASFIEATGIDRGARIRLTKVIPAGAGLGGGSSDAAAVLRCMAHLTGEGDSGLLHTLASELGSDVPFFLGPEPIALGRGRGEILTPLAPLPAGHLVVALPNLHVSTVGAYQALAKTRVAAEQAETDGGGPTSPEATVLRTRGDETFQGLDWMAVRTLAENDFEGVVAPRYDPIGASIDGLVKEGAVLALLSGSGAASFGLFEDRGAAGAAASALTARLGWPFVLARTLTALPDFENPPSGG